MFFILLMFVVNEVSAAILKKYEGVMVMLKICLEVPLVVKLFITFSNLI